MGEGFALRWCQKHDVIVGSRDAQKRSRSGRKLHEDRQSNLRQYHWQLSGNDNISFQRSWCFDMLDTIWIHWWYMQLTGKLRDDCIVVSPIVPMARTEAGFVYPIRRSRQRASGRNGCWQTPPRSRVVSAFHTISESKLKNLQQSLDADTFICGDDQT